MNVRIGDWMQVRSGKAYWPLDPRPEDVDIHDIAHGLSMICRFGGHVDRFFSVAEHSVLVSRVVEAEGHPKNVVLQALLHDATEAYVGDVVRPLKQNLPAYEKIEDKNWRAIAAHFDIDERMHSSIKRADNTVLLAERDALLRPPPIPWEWAKDLVPADVPIVGYLPVAARMQFLVRFSELTC